MSIRDDLIATAEETKAKAAADAETSRQLDETLMRELPRLYSELASKARAMFEGVPGATVNVDDKVRDIKRGDRVVGRAQLSEFQIEFNGRTLKFADDAGLYIGCHRHIEVTGKGAENPLQKGLKVLHNRANPTEWHVWVAPASPAPGQRPQMVIFNDDVFEQAIRSFFGVRSKS